MPKLLVVDDEIALCDLLRHFFIKQGYRVLMATSGQEALTLLTKEQPDLMLLDVKMPRMSGIEVLKQMCQRGDEVKVVMVSASRDDLTINEAKRLGAVDYVTKPFHLDYLEQVVLKKLAALVPVG